MIHCEGCCAEIHESAKVCPRCGCDRSDEIKSHNFRLWAYAALIFFFYPSGLHYVYVKRWGAAVIWLAITAMLASLTGGLSLIGYYVLAIIHFIVVLFRGQNAIDAKYNYGK